jgi:hypothetical protein
MGSDPMGLTFGDYLRDSWEGAKEFVGVLSGDNRASDVAWGNMMRQQASVDPASVDEALAILDSIRDSEARETIATLVAVGVTLATGGFAAPAVLGTGWAGATAYGAALGVGTDLLTQSIQFAVGVRSEYSVYDTFGSAMGGAAFGVVGKAVANIFAQARTALSPSIQTYLRVSGGRFGNSITRAQNNRIATWLEVRGFKIIGGAGRAPEELIFGPGHRLKGSTYVDITAKRGNVVVRVQTVDTRANRITPTKREAAAARRILSVHPHNVLILVPKQCKGK